MGIIIAFITIVAWVILGFFVMGIVLNMLEEYNPGLTQSDVVVVIICVCWLIARYFSHA